MENALNIQNTNVLTRILSCFFDYVEEFPYISGVFRLELLCRRRTEAKYNPSSQAEPVRLSRLIDVPVVFLQEL